MASRSTRFFAKLFDGMVLVAIMLPSFLSSAPTGDLQSMTWLTKISILVFIFYLLFQDGLGGQSIGKRVMRISVISASSRRPCNIFQSLVRNASIVIFSIVDVLLITNHSQRRLGDWLAGTVVVQEENMYHW
jgi:uncharacterized RDD family membrane protein YckC